MNEPSPLSTEDSPKSSSEALRPSLSFETITFSDDTTLMLEENDIVVFVGPNNAGKSAALKELGAWAAESRPGAVIKHATIRRTGTEGDFRTFLEKNSLKKPISGGYTYDGIGYHIHDMNISNFYSSDDRRGVVGFFIKTLETSTRLQGSSAAPPIELYRAPPTHPIHLLLMDDKIAADISEKFKHAFGKDLTLFRGGGSHFPLYVGKRPIKSPDKDELSKEFIDNLIKTNTPLYEEGDGMRSFTTVILNIFTCTTHSILLIDEPEAFLHPPQARLLGKYIAQSGRAKSQLFVATHSTDIFDGLLEGSSSNVRIVRIRREGDINHVKELSKDQTLNVSKDPLAKFSRVFEGIFFEHVVICESDADCMFYQSILNLPLISGDRRPDVLFVHTSGKHRMAKLADTLRALNVPVSVIADIDVLNDEKTFRELIEKLGGDWSSIASCWTAVSTAVQKKNPPLNASQIAGMIATEIEKVTGTGDFPKANEQAIKKVFKTASPWSQIKQSGKSALPSGEPTLQYNELEKKCSDLRLWIVPVGELEGFCKSVGMHGPRFVEKILEEKNLENDAELQIAREFVSAIWKSARP